MTATVSSGFAATETPAADVAAVLTGLDSGDLDQVKQAVQEARRSRDEVVPALIEEFHRRAAAAREGRMPEGSLFLLGLSLITEFKAKEALPVILEILTLPKTLPEDLLDDFLTETMPRTLATLAGDQLELLDGLIRDPNVNEYSRWAALRVRSFLVRDGRLSPADAVKALLHHLRDASDRMDKPIGAPLVLELTALGGREAYDTIVEAFKAGIVDSRMIDLSEAEEEFGEAGYKDRSLQHLPPTNIDDTITEISEWNWGGECDDRGGAPISRDDFPTLREFVRSVGRPEAPILEDLPSREPIRHEGHIGRNEPCPCGSGKKFKKCCGKPGA